jgi:DNA-binding CsgD family transcriptional regulator
LIAALVDLQREAPYSLAALTIRRHPSGPDQPAWVYGMSESHVKDGILEFIPRSAYFQSVLASPEDILDWSVVPRFSETAMARDHLISMGVTQGMSFALMSGTRVVGSLHFNFMGIREFHDRQYQALDRARRTVQQEVSAYVLAGDLGLTRREREILHLMAEGASNAEIGDAFSISHHTVKRHVEHVLDKLRVANRIQAVRKALMLGLV